MLRPSFVAGVVLALLLVAGAARAGIDRWTSTGPYGGTVPILVADPKTSGTLYAAAASNGGIYKSTDGGASWVAASTGIPDRNIAALTIDPVTPTILYASSTDFGLSDFGLAGVFKSTDSGQSWTKLPVDPQTFLPGLVQAFAIDPQNTATIYAATNGNGVLKSTDGGQSWATGNGLPVNANFTSLVIDPQNPATLYAGSTEGSISGVGLFKSTDGGATWNAANSGIAGTTLDVLGLAIDPQNPATLYASMDTFNSTSGVYKSTDGGGSWALVDGNIGGPIAIDPQSSTTLYVGGGAQDFGLGSGVVKSTDGGTSFTPVDSGLGSIPVNALAIDPATPGHVYAGTSNGVFATTNAGSGWAASNNGLALMAIGAVATDPTAPSTVYVGTGNVYGGGAGIFKSTDGGDSWTAINNGLTESSNLPTMIGAIAIDPSNPQNLYAGDGTFQAVFKSTDGGASWAESDNGINVGGSVVSIVVDPMNSANVYTGTPYGVFKSTDAGANWALADDGLPATGNGSQGVTRLAIAKAPRAELVIGTDGNGAFTSTDGASSWQPLSSPTSGNARPLVGSPDWCYDFVGDIAFFGCDCYIDGILVDQGVLEACKDVFSYPDNGHPRNGASVSAGPPAGSARTAAAGQVTGWGVTDGASESVCAPLGPLAADPLQPTVFYLGSGCGVLRATNSGAQIVALSSGLPQSMIVTALAITPNASDLYAGSSGGGLYRYSIVDSPLAAAVLPSSRSVGIGASATAFATLINGGISDATGCALAPITALPADFSYQTTAAGTNALTGSPNTPATIPAGSYQTFLFSITPSQEIDPIDAQIEFGCTGVAPASVLPGIDTLLVSGSSTPVADLVALAATPTGDGIVDLPGTSGANAFAVATINLGAGSTITATPSTGAATLPISLSICQTVPSTGQCQATAAPSVSASIDSNATPTFAIFVGGGGTVPFDPAGNRIAVQFVDGSGNIRGSTSVAVRTQ